MGSYHVVYHAQCGHQLSPGGQREQFGGERQDQHGEGAEGGGGADVGEFAGVFGAERVKGAGDERASGRDGG